MMEKNLTIEELFALLKQKLKQRGDAAGDKNSYTNQLIEGGVEKITRKIGEEAVEVVIAAFLNDKHRSQKTRDDLIGEVCDLFYHNLVLLASQDIELDEVLSELTKRNNRKK